MTTTNKPSPIEVILTQGNMQITCRVVRDDESTYRLDVDSLSMRGAQREVTGGLIADGYTPVGRWGVEARDPEEDPIETVRRFKLAAST